jgi:hypothetical protein
VVATAGALLSVIAGLGAGTAGASGLPQAAFHGHGSIDQAYAIGAPPGAHVTLLNASGSSVGTGVVDSLGGVIVRNVVPGPATDSR